MRKLLLISILLFTLIVTPSTVSAQSMPALSEAEGMGNWTSSPSGVASEDHTAQEEAEGKVIWEKLQAKQLECQDLTDDNYATLGEYFMGQFVGDKQRHAVMNQMMTNMMGEKGEEQMHIVMGKRLSGCNPSAQVPSSGIGFMPMMFLLRQGLGGQGTKGGENSMMGYNWNNMMGGWNGFGLLGWLPMLLFWALLIFGVVALIRYLGRSGQPQVSKTPLEVLKERYAKGEIDKKEFEEKKRDLV